MSELVGEGKLCVEYVSTVCNDADVFTKPLGNVMQSRIRNRFGIHAIEEKC